MTQTDLREIPFERGLPIVGVGLSLMQDPERALREMYERHGPIFRFKAARFDYVCMAGQEANDFVNAAGKDFFITRPFWEPLARELNAPNSVVALDGDPHRIVRRALKHPLSRKVVDENISDVVRIVRENFDSFSAGDSVRFVHASQKLSSNIVGYLLMEMVPSDEELREFFHYANTLTVVLNVLRLPASVLRLQGPRFRHAKAVTKSLIDRVVAKALTERHSRKLLIDALKEAQKEYPELFTEGDIRSSGFLAFFGGIDTMGQTLVFMFWELLKQPELLERVQAEVDAVFSAAGGVPSMDDLQNGMPLCRAVFMEALRLHPTAFGIVRSAADDFVFGGCKVRQGQDLLIYTTLTHRIEEYFPDPDRFDIGRYLAPRFEHRKRGVYTPFGRGPHTCAGAAWSEAQSILMLSTLLYYYRFELPEEMKTIRKKMKTTPTLGEKFYLRISPREG